MPHLQHEIYFVNQRLLPRLDGIFCSAAHMVSVELELTWCQVLRGRNST